MADDPYTHGHHDSVLRSHRWRTAENSAAYLLPHLRPGQRLLDVGCGPGTLTCDLAARVAPGQTVGIDRAPEVLDAARRHAADVGCATVAFEVADLHALPDGAEFDVVHAHQVLQHLADPVGALRALRRVLAPGGLLAVRDGDYGAFTWWPPDPLLGRWLELYHQVTAANGGDADAGRRLASWVRAAGFDDAVVTTSAWTFADPVSRSWWGDLWAERVERSDFARHALAHGLSDERELSSLAGAFRRWAAQPDGVFVVPSVEVLARR